MMAIKIHRSIAEIPAAEWNALVTADTVPFLEWEWLFALEESGSIAAETGWYPLHLGLWEGEHLAAAAPLYLKTNSDGEFVYDYFWAEAAGSLGKPWYPKLVGTCAAAPVDGYRFLWRPGMDGAAISAALLEAAETICKQNGILSLNILFAESEWAKTLAALGYTAWDHSHFLWENSKGTSGGNFKEISEGNFEEISEGNFEEISPYTNFEDYLSRFSKNQRKNIRKEYRRPAEQGAAIGIVEGEAAAAELFEKMFELFTITNDKFAPWDARWVNRGFFRRLEQSCRKRVVFVEARRVSEACREADSPGQETAHAAEGELIALAMLVRKGDRIWGRYWGACEEVKDLHFAACYYAPMDWAIREGIRFFDPGAGSPHKIRRGFRAVQDRSWHKFFDPALGRLFMDNIAAVNQYEGEQMAELNEGLPLKIVP